jgi:predicted nucleic acid-binding protein
VGLILDSSILITAERRVETVSSLLRRIKEATGQIEVAISAISVIELGHGIWRANTPERAEKRRIYLQEVDAAIKVEPFTKEEMGERAARIDAEGKKTGQVIPFADLQIGVTALEPGHSIATHNARHFAMIPGLEIKPLWSTKASQLRPLS